MIEGRCRLAARVLELGYVGMATADIGRSCSLAAGTRVPAYASALGRVLLSGLAPEELDAYPERTQLVVPTPRTVTDPTRLHEVVTEV